MSCTYSIQGLMTMEEGHKVQPQGQDRGRARQQGSDTHQTGAIESEQGPWVAQTATVWENPSLSTGANPDSRTLRLWAGT